MSEQELTDMKKILLGLSYAVWKELLTEAKAKGISVQELIRAVIIPHWRESKKNEV